MLYCIEAGAVSEHPPGENPANFAIKGDFVNFDECVRLRRRRVRTRVAHARRKLQRAELHCLVDINVEGGDAAGDLIEAGEDGDRIGDLLVSQCRALTVAVTVLRAIRPVVRRRDIRREGKGQSSNGSFHFRFQRLPGRCAIPARG